MGLAIAGLHLHDLLCALIQHEAAFTIASNKMYDLIRQKRAPRHFAAVIEQILLHKLRDSLCVHVDHSVMPRTARRPIMEPPDANEDAMESMDDDPEFWLDAGPAVLRLKLLEVRALLQRRDIHDDIRAAARSAASELRRLIADRPCVSSVDIAAKKRVFEEDADSHFAEVGREMRTKFSPHLIETPSPVRMSSRRGIGYSNEADTLAKHLS